MRIQIAVVCLELAISVVAGACMSPKELPCGDRQCTAGVDGDQTDNSVPFAGAVYVFTRNAATWTQQAYIKASTTYVADAFGLAVALSADGSTLAVGALEQAHTGTPPGNGDPDNPTAYTGGAYVFARSGETWTQQAYLKASNASAHAFFGASIALSADGAMLAVGARGEASAATGVDGDQTDHSAPSAGAAYLFTRSDATWTQQTYVKASNTNRADLFGFSVALSGDASTLAAGAVFESSIATGVDGDQADNSAPQAGAAYVFY